MHGAKSAILSLFHTADDKYNIAGYLAAKTQSVCLSVCLSSEVFTSPFCIYRVDSGVPRRGCSNPPAPEIPKALQNGAKLNPIVRNVRNCLI